MCFLNRLELKHLKEEKIAEMKIMKQNELEYAALKNQNNLNNEVSS